MSLSKDGPDGWFVRAVARLLCLTPADVRVSLRAERSAVAGVLDVEAIVQVKRGPKAPWEPMSFEFHAIDAGGRSPKDFGIQPWTVEDVSDEAAGRVLAWLARPGERLA